jgi:hypothetical protein
MAWERKGVRRLVASSISTDESSPVGSFGTSSANILHEWIPMWRINVQIRMHGVLMRMFCFAIHLMIHVSVRQLERSKNFIGKTI